MIKLDMQNSDAIICAAQEIMDNGELWVKIGDDTYYIPELIEQLENLAKQILVKRDDNLTRFV